MPVSQLLQTYSAPTSGLDGLTIDILVGTNPRQFTLTPSGFRPGFTLTNVNARVRSISRAYHLAYEASRHQGKLTKRSY